MENKLETITCKNCGNTFHGNYCNICGQKVINGRYTLKVIFKDIAITIFNFEKGFFYTIKLLLLNPGKVIREYLNGATKKYYNPFKLVIIITGFLALFVLISNTYDKNIGSFNEALSEKIPEVSQEIQSPLQLRIQSFLKRNINIVMLLFVPFYSIGYRIFYSRKSLNYTEHLIINSYAFCMGSILSLPLSIITLILNKYFWIEQLAGFIILILTYAYFYNSTLKSKFGISLFKSIFSQILGFLFMLISVMIISMTVTFVIMVFIQ